MNSVTQIAARAGRKYITPEDVEKAMEAHRNDPDLVRLDVLEVLGKLTNFGAEDPSLCAFVAFEGPNDKINRRGHRA
jgi:hypothetical protein